MRQVGERSMYPLVGEAGGRRSDRLAPGLAGWSCGLRSDGWHGA